jgi:hypothetical protein
MADAFVFVNTFRVKEEMLDDYRLFVQKLARFVEDNEPDMVQFGTYFNEESREATALQVHRSVENFAVHMTVASQFIEESRRFIDFADMSVAIYGTPTEPILEQMRGLAGAGIEVSVNGAIASFHRFR